MTILANTIRKNILKISNRCQRSTHIGGSLSIVEILTVLYRDIMHYDVVNPLWDERDRFILSKGHCVLALYAILYELGGLSQSDVDSIMQDGTDFGSHPVMNPIHMIESSNGSLGQGLGFAAGIALAGKIKNCSYHTYVLLGNGECDEGAVFEAAFFASQKKLNNLTVIIDNNGLQSDGESRQIADLSGIGDIFSALDFKVIQVDGHNEQELKKAFLLYSEGKPKVIIANTIKGKGISFMENNNAWHHNRLIDEDYEKALSEIEKQ